MISMSQKILQMLVEEQREMRFSELREKLDNPSKSVFSAALRRLADQNLINKTEVSYKYVTYSLNTAEYEKKLQKEKEITNSTLSKLRG